MKYIYSEEELQAAQDYITKYNKDLAFPFNAKKFLLESLQRVKENPDISLTSTAGLTLSFSWSEGYKEESICDVGVTVSPTFEEREYKEGEL